LCRRGGTARAVKRIMWMDGPATVAILKIINPGEMPWRRTPGLGGKKGHIGGSLQTGVRVP